VGRYHGSFNYVQTLRYLYITAQNYLTDDMYDHTIDNTAVLEQPHANLVKADISQLFRDAGTLFVPINSGERKAWVVIGMIAHLTGDIYAHRAIVPREALALADQAAFHGTRFRASEFQSNSESVHTCGESALAKDILLDALNNFARADQEGRVRTGCWACARTAIEHNALKFNAIQSIITNKNLPVIYPDLSPGIKWAYYEDYAGKNSFYGRRFAQSKYAMQNIFGGLMSGIAFDSYWLVPSNENNPRSLADTLAMDYLVDYTRAAQPDAPWLQDEKHYANSNYFCNGGPDTTCGTAELHYVVYPTAADAFNRTNALPLQGEGKQCNRRPTPGEAGPHGPNPTLPLKDTFRLWGKATRWEKTPWNWFFCIACFGWAWMAIL